METREWGVSTDGGKTVSPQWSEADYPDAEVAATQALAWAEGSTLVTRTVTAWAPPQGS